MVSCQFLPLTDSFQPWGQTDMHSLEKAREAAKEKWVEGLPAASLDEPPRKTDDNPRPVPPRAQALSWCGGSASMMPLCRARATAWARE